MGHGQTRAAGAAATQLLGRYAIYGELASGGMATISYGRLIGPHGFARPVAIKRMHPHLARDPELVAMFIDEGRLSSRLHHANVIATLDVIEEGGALALVMEYVHGETLAALLERARKLDEPVPVGVIASVLCGVLHGLHAAHEALNERGEPLRIIHRDVSTHNVLVGEDGLARVLDFGVAKARGRLRTTHNREVKGTLAYIAPEQLASSVLDRRADVYGASVVLWEMLTGRPLFDGPNDAAIVHAVVQDEVPAPSSERPEVTPALDAIVMRGLSRDREQRFASAQEMALALEREVGTVAQTEVADWLRGLAGARLSARALRLQAMQERAEPEGSATALESGTRRLPAAGAKSAVVAEVAPADVEEITTRRPRQPLLRYGMVAGAIALAVGTLFGIARSREANAARADLAKAEAMPVAAAAAVPEPESVSVPVRNTEPEAVPVADTEPETDRAPAPARKLRISRRAPEPAPEPDSAPARPTAADRCALPYVIDSQGVRHPKPECL